MQHFDTTKFKTKTAGELQNKESQQRYCHGRQGYPFVRRDNQFHKVNLLLEQN